MGGQARTTISQFSAPLCKEKASKQVQRLEEFAEVMPDCSNVTKFQTSKAVDGFYNDVLHRGQEVTRDQLLDAEIIVHVENKN